MAGDGVDAKASKVPLSVRISPAVKTLLDEAAAASGRSITQEVETRLEASFNEELIGDEPTPVLLRAVSAAIRAQELRSRANWVDGGECSRRAYEAARTVLQAIIMPEGVSMPDWAVRAKAIENSPPNKLTALTGTRVSKEDIDLLEAHKAGLEIAIAELSKR